MAAVRHAIAPRGHRIRCAPDRGGGGRLPERRRFWNTGRWALAGGGGTRRRRRGRMGDRAERRERGGVGCDERGEVMWGWGRGRGRPRSPSSVSLCVSLSLPCCACVCTSSHIFLSREVTWWGFYMWTLAKEQNIFLTQGM